MIKYLLCACLLLTTRSLAAQMTPPIDLVIVGGRVIDPQTKLDAVRTVGVNHGKIGFIDLHSHGQDSTN